MAWISGDANGEKSATNYKRLLSSIAEDHDVWCIESSNQTQRPNVRTSVGLVEACTHAFSLCLEILGQSSDCWESPGIKAWCLKTSRGGAAHGVFVSRHKEQT